MSLHEERLVLLREVGRAGGGDATREGGTEKEEGYCRGTGAQTLLKRKYQDKNLSALVGNSWAQQIWPARHWLSRALHQYFRGHGFFKPAEISRTNWNHPLVYSTLIDWARFHLEKVWLTFQSLLLFSGLIWTIILVLCPSNYRFSYTWSVTTPFLSVFVCFVCFLGKGRGNISIKIKLSFQTIIGGRFCIQGNPVWPPWRHPPKINVSLEKIEAIQETSAIS